MLSYSPNMLKTFQACPKKYQFKYVMNLSVPQRASLFEKGKKIHALANYYLRGEDITKLEQALNSEEKAVWERLKSNEYFQKKYINSEYNLSCKVDKYWIGGRLDAVVTDETNIYILDYKTGEIPKNAEYDYQTEVYLLCLSELLKTCESLYFVYIDLKNNRNNLIEFNSDKCSEYKKMIIDICSKIENYESSDTVYSKRCDFCEYRKFCSLS